MKNTKQTIKQAILAASVALTMGVASATAVPGMPSGTDFEFNGTSALTTGTDAIANVGAILSAVHTEGAGSSIDQSAFWNSFISDTKVQVFNYTNSKDFIEELIFLVDGTASRDASTGSTGYFAADSITANGNPISGTNLSLFDSFTAAVADGGKGYDGSGKRLKITGANALTLLTNLGFDTTGNANFGAATYNTDGTNATMTFDVDAIADPSVALNKSVVLASDSGVAFLASVNAAKVDETNFTRANQLIDLISEQLRNGYILDTANATKAVEAVIAQHNEFLGASIVSQAKGIKEVVKNIGMQIAAGEVGKAAGYACVVNDAACTEIGIKFDDIASQITSVDNGASIAASYNAALVAIDGFANNLINFNGDTVAGNYSGSAAHTAIKEQFGTISVVEVSQFMADGTTVNPDYATSIYGQLENSPNVNPFGFDAWTSDDATTNGLALADFDSAFSIDLESLTEAGDLNGTPVETSVGNLH